MNAEEILKDYGFDRVEPSEAEKKEGCLRTYRGADECIRFLQIDLEEIEETEILVETLTGSGQGFTLTGSLLDAVTEIRRELSGKSGELTADQMFAALGYEPAESLRMADGTKLYKGYRKTGPGGCAILMDWQGRLHRNNWGGRSIISPEEIRAFAQLLKEKEEAERK